MFKVGKVLRSPVAMALMLTLLSHCQAGPRLVVIDSDDAGTTKDAGVPDAGVPDAGVPDAGVPDAGVPDAGVPDAGVPDAGVPDAGSGQVTGTLTLLAGSASGDGYTDGTGSSARFWIPNGIVADHSGNLYVADADGTVIRKITPSGVVSTLAGSSGQRGFADGVGSAARFTCSDFLSTGMAVDASENVYVADCGNEAIRKITPTGVVSTVASGLPGPRGIALDPAGNIYFAGTDDHTIHKITPAGVDTTLAGSPGHSGHVDGTGSVAQFYTPTALAVDSVGNIYVAESYGGDDVRKVSPAGLVTTVSGIGGFFTSIAVDASDNLYVLSASGSLFKVTSAGSVSVFAGSSVVGYLDASGNQAMFDFPLALTVDSAGNVYVADTFNSVIRKVTPSGTVTTFAGSVGWGSVDGAGNAARFGKPDPWGGHFSSYLEVLHIGGVTADRSGNVYVADTDNSTVRKITSSGGVSTLAGAAGQNGYVEGTGSAARFGSTNFALADWQHSIAADAIGNVYLADSDNCAVRKISSLGVVTTLAGSHTCGSADGTGGGAHFSQISGLAADASGVVYVVDHTAIRKITPAGVVTTLSQTGSAVTLDSVGNLYIANSLKILKVTSTGVATTVYDGDYLDGDPLDMVVDSFGNIYFTTAGRYSFPESVVKRVTPAGVVSTVVGTPLHGQVIPGPLPASLFGVLTIALLPNQDLVIGSDYAVLIAHFD